MVHADSVDSFFFYFQVTGKLRSLLRQPHKRKDPWTLHRSYIVSQKKGPTNIAPFLHWAQNRGRGCGGWHYNNYGFSNNYPVILIIKINVYVHARTLFLMVGPAWYFSTSADTMFPSPYSTAQWSGVLEFCNWVINCCKN